MQQTTCVTQTKPYGSIDLKFKMTEQKFSDLKSISRSACKNLNFASFETEIVPTFIKKPALALTKLTVNVDNEIYKDLVESKNSFSVSSNAEVRDFLFLKEKIKSRNFLINSPSLDKQTERFSFHDCLDIEQVISRPALAYDETKFYAEERSDRLTQCEASSTVNLREDPFGLNKTMTKDFYKHNITSIFGDDSLHNEHQLANRFSVCDGFQQFEKTNSLDSEISKMSVDEFEKNDRYKHLQSPLCCRVIEDVTTKSSSQQSQHLKQNQFNLSKAFFSEPLGCDSSAFYNENSYVSNSLLFKLLDNLDNNQETKVLPDVSNKLIVPRSLTSTESRDRRKIEGSFNPLLQDKEASFNEKVIKNWIIHQEQDEKISESNVLSDPFCSRTNLSKKNLLIGQENSLSSETCKSEKLSSTLLAVLESYCAEAQKQRCKKKNTTADPKNCSSTWKNLNGHAKSTTELRRLASEPKKINSELFFLNSHENKHLNNEKTVQFTCCFDGETLEYDSANQTNQSYASKQVNQNTSVLSTSQNTTTLLTIKRIINELYSLEKNSTRQKVTEVAKQQSGSRYLQQLLTRNNDLLIPSIILSKMLESLHELMIDPYGNYLCQRLFESCSSVQRQQIIVILSPRIKDIACHHIGTYSMQALVSLIAKSPQEPVLMLVLENHLPGLIVHQHATYIVQKILKCFSESSTDIIFMKVLKDLQKYAVDAHGLCVVKCCITFSAQRSTYCHRYLLSQRLTPLTLTLVQSHFGNYAVQHAFETWGRETCSEILEQIKEHVVQLSTQKFSSNVVEKAIEISNSSYVEQIVKTLTHSANMTVLMNSVYGCFVFQKLINRVSLESVHSLLMVATTIKHTIPKEHRARHKWNKAFENARKRLHFGLASCEFDITPL